MHSTARTNRQLRFYTLVNVLFKTDTTNPLVSALSCSCEVEMCAAYRFVEVEETFRAVDIMEGGERLDGAIDGHWMKPHRPPRGDQHPVRRRAADKYLPQQGSVES